MLTGTALKIKRLEDAQAIIPETEERIKEYILSFQQTRASAEQGTQLALIHAATELQAIREMTEVFTTQLPVMAARMEVIAAWQQGFDARVNGTKKDHKGTRPGSH